MLRKSLFILNQLSPSASPTPLAKLAVIITKKTSRLNYYIKLGKENSSFSAKVRMKERESGGGYLRKYLISILFLLFFG
jgi:hypothetical protein